MSGKPKINLLNANELMAQIDLNNKIESNILVRGLKAKFTQKTNEERAAIKSYQGAAMKLI